MNGHKLHNWDGANKHRVRLYKKFEITRYIKEDRYKLGRSAVWIPRMVSLPGPKAAMERLLVNHGILKSKNIIAIQTYEKMSNTHKGEYLLKQLVSTRNKHLKEMRIWPYNLKSFSERYHGRQCGYPSESDKAKWSAGKYKKLMDEIVENKVNKISILDIDLCGIFSKTNADTIENFFKNGNLDPSGLLFVTHQKGRDVRGGALFSILNNYLESSPYVLIDSIHNSDKEEYKTYNARYILIPLYYMCKAREYGYYLTLKRLIEYRDVNKASGLAVNMLQYFFKWYRIDKLKMGEELSKQELEKVMSEEYPYIAWV